MNNTKKKTKSNVKYNKNKRKHLRVYIILALVLVVLSLLALMGFGIYYLSTSPKFKVTNVVFKNNKVYDVQELEDTAKVQLGENIYRISKKQIETNLKTLPYVKSVSISRKLPSTLVISVNEYSAKYIAYNAETRKYIRLTKEGLILTEVEPETKDETELLVFGISFDDEIIAKNYIADTEVNKLAFYEKTNEAYLKSGITKKITSVEFKNKNIIVTLDYDINVIMDDDDLDYDMKFLKSILEELGSKAGTIDMTGIDAIFTESIK